MITPHELISVCRQIGGMMEAGVDILRITRVLRSQTTNERLLDLYDNIDHELTMGRGLADVLARASDVFSPFAISLVRQGEERNNLAAAFLRIADFLEREVDLQKGAPTSSQVNSSHSVSSLEPLTDAGYRIQIESQQAASEVLWLRSVWLLCAWMSAIAIVLLTSEVGWLEARWRGPISLLLCAAIGSVAAWNWTRVANLASTTKIATAPDFSAQSTAELAAPEAQSTTPQSTLGEGWDEIESSNGSNRVQAPSHTTQSTLNGVTSRDTINREEKDGTETDASALLDRLKNRPPCRDAPEEEFD
jgi:hypothetical protein